MGYIPTRLRSLRPLAVRSVGCQLVRFREFQNGVLGFWDVAVRSVRATQSFGRKRLQASR